MGVVISSTEEGVGCSCEIMSCAELREIVPRSNSKSRGIVLKQNEANGHGKKPLANGVRTP